MATFTLRHLTAACKSTTLTWTTHLPTLGTTHCHCRPSNLRVLAGLMVHLMHRLIIGEHDQTGLALVKQTLQAPMFWTAVAPCIWLWQLLPGCLACRTCGWETSAKAVLSLLLSGIVGALIGVYTLGPVAPAVL